MPLAIEKIEALAPDQASLAAAVKIKPAAWSLLALNHTNHFAWGECQGSGSTPYRVCVETTELSAKCTCPSRKFPCKHSLSLMLLLAKAPQSFQSINAVPDWVTDWAGRRRPARAGKPQEGDTPRASLDAVVETQPQPRSEKAQARAAQQRDNLRAQREQAILAGLDELDRWIEDRLNRGLAGFMADASQQCRLLAQRMVDAKATGIATWVDSLPSQILALPERMRSDAAIEDLGSLHLLAEAYRRQDQLPDALRHDVRRLVGWAQERQALLDDASALRISADWTVIATHAEVQPDKVRRMETWLMAIRDEIPTYAVLIDFVPVATSADGSSFLPGETFAAELVFYPSAAPLRAALAQRSGDVPSIGPAVGVSLASALDAYDGLRTKQPWLRQWPITVNGVTCNSYGADGLWLVNGDAGVPIAPPELDKTRVLTELDKVRVLTGVSLRSITGVWDGRCFTPMIADTAMGRWARR